MKDSQQRQLGRLDSHVRIARSPLTFVNFGLVLLLSLSLATNSQAQLFWNTNGVSADWTANNWGTSVGGPFTSGWSDNSNVNFNANSTVNWVNNQRIGNITVADGATVILNSAGSMSTGGNIRMITVGTGATLDFTGNGTAQEFSNQSGTGFIKEGAGTWIVGNQTRGFNAGMTLNAGTIVISGGNALGGEFLALNGGTLQSSNNITIANASIIGGNFTLSGSDTTTFSGTVNLGTTTRTITNNASGSRVFSGVISGTAGLTFNSTAAGRTFIGNSGNTFSGPITIQSGTVGFANDGAYGVGSKTVIINGGELMASSVTGGAAIYTLATTRSLQLGPNSGNVINVASTGSLTYNGVISNSTTSPGSFAKRGSGTLILGGASTYTGTTSIEEGRLRLSTATNRLPTSTIVNFGRAGSSTLGTLDLNGQSQTIAGLNSVSGTNTTTNNNTVTSSTAATLTINGSSNSSFGDGTNANSGVISGALNIVKSGAGTLTLGDANTYTGATTVQQGTLSVSQIDSNGVSSNIGNATSAVTLGTATNQGTLSYTGTDTTYTRGFTIGGNGGGRLNVVSSGTTLTVATNGVTGTGGFTVGGAGSTSISATLAQVGSLTKDGTGTLTLSGANTYTGVTSISAGTLVASNIVVSGGSSNLGNATSAVNLGAASTQGTLSYTGSSATYTRGFNVSAGGGRLLITSAGSTVTIDTAGATGTGRLTVGGSGSTIVNSTLAQLGGLTKEGSGNMTLNGANTYTGSTIISEGTVNASNIVVSGGSSNLGNATSAVTLGSSTAQGTLSYSGNSATYTRGFIIGGNGGGQLLVTNSGQTLTVNTAGISGSGLLTIGGAGSTTINSIVSHNGGITKIGSGTLTQSGANTYTGITTVSEGTLSASNIVVSGGSSNLGNATSAVVLGSSSTQGTLSYTGNSATYTRGLTIAGAGGARLDVTTAGQTLTVATNGVTGTGNFTVGGSGSTTISASLAQVGNLTKEGSGTLTLSGANTYAGTTTVNNGTLVLENSQAIADSGAVVIANNAGANVQLNSDERIGSLSGGGTTGGNVNLQSNTLTVGDSSDTTFAGNMSGTNGSVVKEGTGTLTLSGTNTNTGSTTVNQGTLALSGGSAIHDAAAVIMGNNATANLFLQNSERIGRLSGGGTLGGNVNLQSNTLTVGDAANTTYAGSLSGVNGNVVKQGTGTLELSGVNTYSGSTTVNQGTLAVTGGSAINDAAAVILGNTSGAGLLLNNNERIGSLAGGGLFGGNVNLQSNKLTVGNSSNTNFAGVISGVGGSLEKQGAGTLTLSGNNSYTGLTSILEGTLALDGGNAIADSGAVSVANVSGANLFLNFSERIGSLSGGGALGGSVNLQNHTLTVGDSSFTSFDGVILGANGILVKEGSGSLTLAGNNTFDGSVTINEGTLAVDNGNALADTITVNLTDQAGANLTLNADEVIGQLSGGGLLGGDVNLGDNTLTVGNSSNSTYAGKINGLDGRLVKQGSGELTLSGTNSYTGSTDINAGTLAVSGGGALSNLGRVNMADVAGANLKLNSSETIGSLSGGGALGGNVNLQNNTLVVGDASNTTFSGVISGTNGNLVKQGSGTLTLTNNNTYSGLTTVNDGKLQVNGLNMSTFAVNSGILSLGDGGLITGAVTVQSGGTLSGTGLITGDTLIMGTHSPGASQGTMTLADTTYDSATINWELIANTTSGPGTNFDAIVINGDLDFASPTSLNLAFNTSGSTVNWSDSFWDTPRTGTNGWKLFDVSGTTTGLSNLSVVTANWQDSFGNYFNTVRPGHQFRLEQFGSDVYITAVPEPSSIALIGVGALGGLWLKRRKDRLAKRAKEGLR